MMDKNREVQQPGVSLPGERQDNYLKDELPGPDDAKKEKINDGEKDEDPPDEKKDIQDGNDEPGKSNHS